MKTKSNPNPCRGQLMIVLQAAPFNLHVVTLRANQSEGIPIQLNQISVAVAVVSVIMAATKTRIAIVLVVLIAKGRGEGGCFNKFYTPNKQP